MESMITDKREIASIVSMHEKGLKYTVGEEMAIIYTIDKIIAYTEVDGTLWAAVYREGEILTRVPLANFAVCYAATKGL